MKTVILLFCLAGPVGAYSNAWDTQQDRIRIQQEIQWRNEEHQRLIDIQERQIEMNRQWREAQEQAAQEQRLQDIRDRFEQERQHLSY